MLTDDDYFAKLQDLLLELAQIDQELKLKQQDSPEPEVRIPFLEDDSR